MRQVLSSIRSRRSNDGSRCDRMMTTVSLHDGAGVIRKIGSNSTSHCGGILSPSGASWRRSSMSTDRPAFMTRTGSADITARISWMAACSARWAICREMGGTEIETIKPTNTNTSKISSKVSPKDICRGRAISKALSFARPRSLVRRQHRHRYRSHLVYHPLPKRAAERVDWWLPAERSDRRAPMDQVAPHRRDRGRANGQLVASQSEGRPTTRARRATVGTPLHPTEGFPVRP
jgi:hypothetical protein